MIHVHHLLRCQVLPGIAFLRLDQVKQVFHVAVFCLVESKIFRGREDLVFDFSRLSRSICRRTLLLSVLLDDVMPNVHRDQAFHIEVRFGYGSLYAWPVC